LGTAEWGRAGVEVIRGHKERFGNNDSNHIARIMSPSNLWILNPQNLQNVTVLSFHCCDKIPKVNNLGKERLILAHAFRSFSLWSLGHIALDLW
jgi:hypothetical protein